MRTLRGVTLCVLLALVAGRVVGKETSADPKQGDRALQAEQKHTGEAMETTRTQEAADDDEAVPADFHLVYNWAEGSLPPPYHYAYVIEVEADGAGVIRMTADYPGKGVPVWRERFTVKPAKLERLYVRLLKRGVFSRTWKSPEEMPVGGSSEWMNVMADGEKVEIPAYAAGKDADAIYQPVRDLVPKETWTGLHARLEKYQKEHAHE